MKKKKKRRNLKKKRGKGNVFECIFVYRNVGNNNNFVLNSDNNWNDENILSDDSDIVNDNTLSMTSDDLFKHFIITTYNINTLL